MNNFDELTLEDSEISDEENEIFHKKLDDAYDMETKILKPINTSRSDNYYLYQSLLNKIYTDLRSTPQTNPDFKKRLIIPTIELKHVRKTIGEKEKVIKTIFINFKNICKKVNRAKQHLLSYFKLQMKNRIEISTNKNQVVISGNQEQGFVENIVSMYIEEYVKCHSCRSPNTQIVSKKRLNFVKCNLCSSVRCVKKI